MKKHVLIVDDHADVRKLLVTICRMHGYDVTEAADGATAISAAETAFFDAVILDLRLPDMKAVDVLHRLLAMNPRLNGRVLIVTASAEPSAWTPLIAEGACRVVTKPFEPALLLAALELCASDDDTVTRRSRSLTL